MEDISKYLPAMRKAFRLAMESSDPDRKVGAFFVLEDGTPIIGGTNVILLPFDSVEAKLLSSAHAERMAIHAARSVGWANLSKLTLVVTRHPCANCMMDIWLSGCRKVVYFDNDESNSKWKPSFDAARQIAEKFSIKLLKVPRDQALDEQTSEFTKGRGSQG